MSHADHERKPSKRHAQIRADWRQRPLWVYDQEDWEEMISLPSGSLICPVRGCGSAFQIPQENQHGTRFLKDLPNGGCCAHAFARPEGSGGPMTLRHRWFQSRLARICEVLGYEAMPEHWPTYSDIFVTKVDYSIEFQIWRTDFERRRAARIAAGAKEVIWMIPEDAERKATTRALFAHPAVRIRVRSRDDWSTRLDPWNNRRLESDAILSVYATVARFNETTGSLETRSMSAVTFLREVFANERTWCKPGTAGLPFRHAGAWVRIDDLRRAQGLHSP